MSTQRIFITGGASGLGRAIALRFGRAGWRVCIADVNDTRGAETLQALAPLTSHTHYLRCDVTREEELTAASEWLTANWGGVDVVVNNAGVAQAGGIEDVPLSDWQWIVDINLLGVVRGCKVFTPLFKRQGRGHFVNVASMAGLLDMPRMSSYNATKAAVVSLSETLQNELADDRIGVSLVCPSFFKTNLGDSLRTSDPGMRTALTKLLERSPITADDIADQIFRAVEQREFYVLPHKEGRRAWLMKKLLPRDIYSSMIQKRTRRLRGRTGVAQT
ncbi:SDR family oxidoreductase [Archangium minus]|uniref:SDR family oxidoreductase n=1 Tax=Archangium minus TaxID=83450 RepID=A0ABY9WXB2_9BACT|nr:SDR family oxidoreductase [Archangium minus]